jgi:RimJ/RimL family protein N-acetyltransferase
MFLLIIRVPSVCYEKVGFVHEGCLRQNVYKRGMYVDVIVMSILRSEWNQINKKN